MYLYADMDSVVGPYMMQGRCGMLVPEWWGYGGLQYLLARNTRAYIEPSLYPAAPERIGKHQGHVYVGVVGVGVLAFIQAYMMRGITLLHSRLAGT